MSVKPGQMQAVWMPDPAKSWQQARIMPIWACLLITYEKLPGTAFSDSVEPTNSTHDPGPMCGSTNRFSVLMATTLMSSTARRSSLAVSVAVSFASLEALWISAVSSARSRIGPSVPEIPSTKLAARSQRMWVTAGSGHGRRDRFTTS